MEVDWDVLIEILLLSLSLSILVIFHQVINTIKRLLFLVLRHAKDLNHFCLARAL